MLKETGFLPNLMLITKYLIKNPVSEPPKFVAYWWNDPVVGGARVSAPGPQNPRSWGPGRRAVFGATTGGLPLRNHPLIVQHRF